MTADIAAILADFAKALSPVILYRQFWQMVKKGRAEVEQKNLTVIQDAGTNGQWVASAWICERLAPSRWSNFRSEIRALKKSNEEMQKQLEEIKDAIAPKT